MAYMMSVAAADPTSAEANKLERTLLRDQVVDRLRGRIIGGAIPPGAPLIERDLAEQLGVSRIPVRDALIQLENEGLVASAGKSRAVIQLTEQDVRGLYDLRIALETLAIRLAAQNRLSQQQDSLMHSLRAMQDAMARHDARTFQRNDMEMHRIVWEQSGNTHLVKALSMMVGPIFMLISRHAAHYDWSETLRLHEEMATYITAGNALAAEQSIIRHLENARWRSINLLNQGWL